MNMILTLISRVLNSSISLRDEAMNMLASAERLSDEQMYALDRVGGDGQLGA